MSKEIELNESNINQLYLLYKQEFINFCENIIIENQNHFLDRFYEKMDLIIKNYYGENIFDKIPSLYLTKKQCENKFITDIYWPMREVCLKAKTNFINNKNISNYLTNFRPHCLYDQVPLHICGSKFIQAFDQENKILFVICSGCDKCYYSNFIAMNCHYCQIDFYSEVINIKNNLFLATWKKYHCNNDELLINEEMHCIICNNLFFIKNNKLYCKNCKEYFEPEDIVWNCKICNTEFRSDIKIYNPYEFKEIELIRKDAFLYKKTSKPNYLPCKCISNIDLNNFNFYHEPDGKCKGVMYYCYINNKEFLVCSECKKIFELNKFCWKCPICFKKFIINELKFEDINNDKYNCCYKKIKKNEILSKQNNNRDKKIHTSCSQKIIDIDKKNIMKNNKLYKNLNNSYVKKRINSSFIKSNNNINTNIGKNDNKNQNPINQLNKKKILLKNSNISTNSSNREINSFQNKYNMTSTAYSSFMNNNIKVAQTDRNTTYSFISSKNDKVNNQNNYKINKYINKKILNYPATSINNSDTNRKIYLKSKYQTIDKFMNELDVIDKKKNKHSETSSKSIIVDKKTDSNKDGFLKMLQKGFKKCRKKNYKEKSFCDIKMNNDKSFICQNTDSNQIYFPKKHLHIHRLSEPSVITSPLNKTNRNKNNSIIKYNHSCEKRRMINDEYKEEKKNNKSKLKAYSNIKINSKDKEVNNYLNDHLKKKIKSRKRNFTNFFQNLTENNKGNSLSTKDEKNKNTKNNDISFKKYIKTIYNKKNDKVKKEINNKIKINLENINNNKYKGNKQGNKNEYLTSFNNNIKDNNNKQKYKKENINNKKIINKKIQTSRTKTGLITNSNSRNNKRNGLIDIISNFNQIKNSIHNPSKEPHNLKINTQNIINTNPNITKEKPNNETIIQIKEDSKGKHSITNSSEFEDDLKVFNFEEYKIITQLGQGSFGKIYLVQNAKNELFTMKKLIYSEELDVQSVLKEYKMCYKLKHPNVVKILGIYSKKLDKTTYVVYVLMEVGLTDWEKEIKTHMEKHIFYTENELIHIIKQLSQVLSFLQKSNVSHRDIKPQNILVFKNNIYKIADFGEAKQIENMTINLISNSLRGTELYMSPLLFNGLRTGQVDIKHNVFKSDVYSFGLCILFAASLQIISLYDIRKIVDMNELRNYLNKVLKNQYSKKFIDLVGLLLEIHEKNRPDFIHLEEIMKGWENNE